METLIHADIFFFITTVVTIVVGILLVVILVYIAVILKDLKALSVIVRKEGEEIVTDVHNIRDEIKEEMRYRAQNGPTGMAALLNFAATMMSNRGKAKRPHHHDHHSHAAKDE